MISRPKYFADPPEELSLPYGDDMGMMTDLSESFTRAVNAVLLVAALLAFVTTALVSTFITRRIVSPMQQVKEASQRYTNPLGASG